MNPLRLTLLLVLLTSVPVLAATPAVTPEEGGSAPAALPFPTDPPDLLTPEYRIEDPAQAEGWRELFARLSPQRTRQSAFVERRFFPFRRAPIVLQGEIRIVPGRGLSLRYVEPEPRVLIVDQQGLLMRDAEGRERPAPADSRAQAATSAMVGVLRFDVGALQEQFDLYGRRDGDQWVLGFVARESTFTNLMGVLVVRGSGATLQRIEMIKAANQRIEIDISDTREDVLFTAGTLQRYFR